MEEPSSKRTQSYSNYKARGGYIAVVVRRMCMHIHTIWYVMGSILPYNSIIVAIGYGWQMEI